MTFHLKFCLLLIYVTFACGQYDPYAPRPSGQADPNDRYNQPYDRDRGRQYDRDRPDQYDRDRYDRDRYDQGDRDRHGRNRTDQYGRPYPYDRDGLDRPPYDRDRYDIAGQDAGNNGTDRYDFNRSRSDPYGQYDQRRPYDGQRRPYDGQHRAYDDRRPYDGQRPYDRRGGGYGATGDRIDDSNCCEEYCYLNDRDQYLKFGTKTAYEFARAKATANQHNIPQCRPVQMWSLNKPGTTLPDSQTIDRLMRLNAIHEDVVRNYDVESSYPTRGRMCQEDYNLLKKWQWNRTLSPNMADMLSTQGKEDLRLLARRYQSKFTDLLHAPYTSNHYYFKYSNIDRTYDSYQAYIEGLFMNNAFNVHAEVAMDDNQFGGPRCRNSYGSYDSNTYQSSRPPYQQSQNPNYQNPSYQNPSYQNPNYQNPNYQNPSYQNPNYQNPSYQNPNYQNPSYQNPQTGYQNRMPDVFIHEYNMFKDRVEYRDLVKNVLRRLGFKYVLNETVIEDMYNMCRYEKAWYNNDASPWCAAFTKRQLELLEYGEDLKEYFTTGYGNEEENRRLGCSTVRDMYERFQRTVNGMTNEQKVAVTFTGSNAFNRFLVAMGIAKDNIPLSSTNAYSQSRRKWRTSDISPFTGNLVAILYECDPNQRDTHKVMFYLNEHPVEFMECSVGLCSWETVRSKYQTLVDTCSLDYCNGASMTTSVSLTFFVFLLCKWLF